MYGLTPICNLLNWLGFKKIVNPNDPAVQIVRNSEDVKLFFESQTEPVETHRIAGNKHHFISDPKLVKPLLHEMREGETFSFGHGPFIRAGSGDASTTMLTCPSSEHRRLRSPVETLFTARHLRESTIRCEIAHHIVTTYSYSIMEPAFCILEPPSSCLPFLLISKTVLGFDGDFSKLKPFIAVRFSPKQRALALQELRRAYTQHLYENGKGMDLLQQAEDQGKILEQEKIDTTMILLIAGVHTSDSFLKSILGVISCRSDLREKIIKEWQDFVITNAIQLNNLADYCDWISLFAVGGKKNDQTYPGSQLLSSIYYESVRLFPAVPVMSREAKSSLSIGDQLVEENDFVQLNLRAAQRDPTLWENPKEFTPERFENSSSKSELLTFGLGSQRCIGKDLIEVESKILIAAMLTLFNWNTGEDAIDLNSKIETVTNYSGLTDGTVRSKILNSPHVTPIAEMKSLIDEAISLTSPNIFVHDAEQLLKVLKSNITIPERQNSLIKKLTDAEAKMNKIKSRND